PCPRSMVQPGTAGHRMRTGEQVVASCRATHATVRSPNRETTMALKKKRKTVARKRTRAAKPKAKPVDALLARVRGAERRTIGHVQLEVGRAGAARVKRMIYPPGFRWSRDMKPVTGTDLCMHAHVGFLARGEIHIEYADGCIVEHKAPQIVAIE